MGGGVMGVSTYRAWECVGDGVDPVLLDEEWKEDDEEPHEVGSRGDRTADEQKADEGERKEKDEREEEEGHGSVGAGGWKGMKHAVRVRLGYHLQSSAICRRLHSLVRWLISTRTSAIIEGVHLLPSFLSFLTRRYSSPHVLLLPFIIHISNETKHRERLASRSLSSSPTTLSPPLNQYIAHFPSIRIIQQHLLSHVASAAFPAIDNTNVDRSVAAVHEMTLRVMARMGSGEEGGSGGGKGEGGGGGVGEVVRQEVEGVRKEAWGGKAMQRLLRMKVEKRHLFERLREAERQRREGDEGSAGGGDGAAADAHPTLDGDEEEKSWRLSEKLERLFPSPKGDTAPLPPPSAASDGPSPLSSLLSSPPISVPLQPPPVRVGDQAAAQQGKGGRSIPSAAPLTSLSASSHSPSCPNRPSTRSSGSGKLSPSSPTLSSSLGTPPPFLHHLPIPHLTRRSSSPLPLLPSPEASSVRFTVSDDDDGPSAGGGGRSETDGEGEGEGAGSMAGGSLMAASVDGEEEDGGEEEGEEREEEEGMRGISRIPESEDGKEEGEEEEEEEREEGERLRAGAGSDSESGWGAGVGRGRVDTDEDEEQVVEGDARQSQLSVAAPRHTRAVLQSVLSRRAVSAGDGSFDAERRVVLY